MNKLGCLTLFLSPYAFEYTQVKLFFNTLKNKFEKQTRNFVIKLHTDEGV